MMGLQRYPATSMISTEGPAGASEFWIPATFVSSPHPLEAAHCGGRYGVRPILRGFACIIAQPV